MAAAWSSTRSRAPAPRCRSASCAWSKYGAFERVGGSACVQVDVRVIGATNVDLPSEAAAGLPPGSPGPAGVRRADRAAAARPARGHPLLAEHFGRAMAHDLGWPSPLRVSAPTRWCVLAHPWPGNVRELKNVVEGARSIGPARRGGASPACSSIRLPRRFVPRRRTASPVASIGTCVCLSATTGRPA